MFQCFPLRILTENYKFQKMTILKQSSSKNLRSKGFKVKHFLQICLLLAICFWLLHQVRKSYDRKKAYEEGTATQSEVKSEHEGIKLGRKDVRLPVQQVTLEGERQEVDETEKAKPEESKDEGGGGGDDEIDGNEQDKSEEEEPEEVEDLIDEEDREREDETAEQESEEAENRLEDESLLVNQVHYGDGSSSEAREELYKGENAAGR